MSIPTSQKIVDYITKNTQASGKELGEYLSTISSRAVRKQLKNLFEKGCLRKIGRPPKVYYLLATKRQEKTFIIQKNMKHTLRKLAVSKIKTTIIIPQKTLNKLEDRVENAQRTIIVEEKALFKNILLIDDAVGSGATMNETAKQIKEKNLCAGQIIGSAITGSFKGFDVISEV